MTTPTTPNTPPVVKAKRIDPKAIREKLVAAGFNKVLITPCKRKEGVDLIITPKMAPKAPEGTEKQKAPEMQKQFDDLNAVLKKANLKHKGPRIFHSREPVIVIADVHYKLKQVSNQ